ncbi:hypothetical protein M5I08_12870 [Candidatus Mycobacterium methanotrophicum]|uniref:DNA-binding domain-containing protein n=1 Tax=Candidatus Mycobacterium methanotrophicum TaxID=2943498 RepID=A0ABY4QHN5_9MYCO|nr:hypothetical protein [Candidatus Mycobacterium methanotrophicum]UQX09336.1 hypothetical protein M5I08_12870 [Candidatus Mycobacterium methanotrophicum]
MIAASLRVCAETVRKWRRRWCAAPGAASLGGAKRCGRPPVFTAAQIAQVKAAARIPPADAGLALSRWSCPELCRLRHHERNLRFDLTGHRRPLRRHHRHRAVCPARRPVPQRDPGAHSGACVLAQSDRDLLLYRSAKSALAQRFHRP